MTDISEDLTESTKIFPNIKESKGIDDFLILKILSKKGKKDKDFVAKVKSKLNNGIYAMKKIDKNKAILEGKKIYIEREEEFLKLLSHENIVKYYTSFEDNRFLYIITEYIDNGDLLKMINLRKKIEYQISEEKLMKIFLQCLKSLSFIHSQGIILRALKPDKILIDNENNIKLTNFKYAAVHDENISEENLNISKEKVKQLKHSFEIFDIGIYNPPEMKVEHIYDKKVDVYTLGIIFCSLAYMDYKIPEKNDYSKELADFIAKMIEKEPLNRPTSEEAYKNLRNIYLNKYSNKTGIISCLRCLNSFPNINTDYTYLLKTKQIKEENKPILNDFVKFIELMHDLKQSYNNSENDYGEKKLEELHLFIYDFLEKLHKRGCINLNEYKDISLKDFLFILFSLIERESNIPFLNANINLNEIKKKVNKDSIKGEDPEIIKIKGIFMYFRIMNNITSPFSIIFKTKINCANCNNGVEFYKKNMFISFDVGKLKKIYKDKLDIMSAFKSLDKKDSTKQECEYCGKRTIIEKTTKIFYTPKDLIILFDRGENCKYKDFINFEIDLKLNKDNIELMRGNMDLYLYELYGVIVRKEKNDPNKENAKIEEYVYYTRDFKEKLFIRNDKRDTFNLLEVKSEGDVIALFYYCKELDQKKIITEKKEVNNNSINISINNNINNSINNSINISNNNNSINDREKGTEVVLNDLNREKDSEIKYLNEEDIKDINANNNQYDTIYNDDMNLMNKLAANNNNSNNNNNIGFNLNNPNNNNINNNCNNQQMSGNSLNNMNQVNLIGFNLNNNNINNNCNNQQISGNSLNNMNQVDLLSSLNNNYNNINNNLFDESL